MNSDRETDATNALLTVEVDGGSGTWDTIASLQGNTNGWERQYLSLSNVTITDDIQFRFTYTEPDSLTNNDHIAIDEVIVDEEVTCFQVGNIALSNVSSTGVDVTWNTGGTEPEWDVMISDSTTMNNYISTDTTYSITGLTASTMYDVYVRAICAPGDTSAWTGPVSFMTAPSLPAGVSCNTGVSTPIWSDELDAQGGWNGDFGLGAGSWLAGGPGGTPSGGTGPLQAQSGSGYFFFEASTGGLDTATIVSQAIDLSTAMDDAELIFWVHGHGADIGL